MEWEWRTRRRQPASASAGDARESPISCCVGGSGLLAICLDDVVGGAWSPRSSRRGGSAAQRILGCPQVMARVAVLRDHGSALGRPPSTQCTPSPWRTSRNCEQRCQRTVRETLSEVRRVRKLTLVELPRRMRRPQSTVSRIEREADMVLSTLAACVESPW